MFRSAKTVGFSWSLLTWFLCLAALIACSRDELLTLTLTQAELQQRIEAVFPVKTPSVLAQLTLDQPKVVLAEGSDRIALELRVTAVLPLIAQRQGYLTVSGVPEYRQSEKAFYLVQPRLDRLVIPGVPAAQVELVKAPIEAIANSTLYANAVYRLNDRNLDESAASRVLTGAAVRDGKLVLTLGVPR